MIEEGKPAPMFTLVSDSGEDVSLESFRGQRVVLYFYPRTTRWGVLTVGEADP
jgi:thioredoxin-dependent peroxiredoxin